MQAHLVLFEGVPFTGKSTLSGYAAQQLSSNGFPTQWLSEETMLDRFFPRVLEILEHGETGPLLTNWHVFAQAARESPATFVVDGALTFAALWPLLAANLAQESILAGLKQIAGLCAPLRPYVIHHVGDPGQLTRTGYEQRGARWQNHIVALIDAFPYQQARGRSGADGVTAFFCEAQSLMQAALADGGWQVLTLDVTADDWHTNRQSLLNFLR
jgi:hypothetical protein